MYGKVTIVLDQDKKLLVHPSSCLVGKQEDAMGTVYVVRAGRAQQVAVRLGTDNGFAPWASWTGSPSEEQSDPAPRQHHFPTGPRSDSQRPAALLNGRSSEPEAQARDFRRIPRLRSGSDETPPTMKFFLCCSKECVRKPRRIAALICGLGFWDALQKKSRNESFLGFINQEFWRPFFR